MAGAKAATTPRKSSPSCNVPGCNVEPYHRGLCDEHWATRRDLADPEPRPE